MTRASDALSILASAIMIPALVVAVGTFRADDGFHVGGPVAFFAVAASLALQFGISFLGVPLASRWSGFPILFLVLGAWVQISIMVGVFILTDFDALALVGALGGATVGLVIQWCWPRTIVKALRGRPIPYWTAGFANVPHWLWAPQGQFGLLVALGFLSVIRLWASVVLVYLAPHLLAVLYLMSLATTLIVHRVDAKPRLILSIEGAAILVTLLLACGGAIAS